MTTTTKEATAIDLPFPEEVSEENMPVVAGAMEIQSPDEITPIRPQHVDDECDQQLKNEASAIAAAIIANPSDVEITAQVYGLGSEAEASNTDNVDLINQKIGPVMAEIGTESSVGKSLAEIKANLDLVNPHVVANTEGEFEGKLFGLIKRTVRRLPQSDEVMALINERRDSIATTIDALKQHLWTERDTALKNAIQLGQVANRLATTQNDLQEAVYQGQMIWAQLNEARSSETDPVRQQSLEYLTTDLAMKVVDLQTVDQLNIQSRMGAETLIRNCRGIENLVRRVTNTLLPSVQTALAVKAAASQQAQLAAHAQGITHAAGETIAQTAKDIRSVSVDVARQNTEAVVDLEKLEEAASQYEMMQSELEEVMRNAESNARTISNRMGRLNDRMRSVADPLTQARQAKEEAGV